MDLKQKIPIYLSYEDIYQCALLCAVSAIALKEESEQAPERERERLLGLAEKHRRISNTLISQTKLKE